MKKSDEMIKKIRVMEVRLDVIHDLEGLINQYERTKHEIPCDTSPELIVLIQARYDAKINLLKKVIDDIDTVYFDLPEAYLK